MSREAERLGVAWDRLRQPAAGIPSPSILELIGVGEYGGPGTTTQPTQRYVKERRHGVVQRWRHQSAHFIRSPDAGMFAGSRRLRSKMTCMLRWFGWHDCYSWHSSAWETLRGHHRRWYWRHQHPVRVYPAIGYNGGVLEFVAAHSFWIAHHARQQFCGHGACGGPFLSTQFTQELAKEPPHLNCLPFLGHEKWEASLARIGYLLKTYT